MEELENIKKQFDELMAKAEEIVKRNGKVDGRWRAGYVEEYYSIVGYDFEVHSDSDNYAPRDDMLYEEGNYFQTEEEAEKVAQHFKDYLILRADAKGFEFTRGGEVWGWQVFYDYRGEEGEFLFTYDTIDEKHQGIYFETREDAEASIKKHGDIWTRYLGVEE